MMRRKRSGGACYRLFKKQNISKIDILIGYHPHSDHIGGMDAVINQFSVGEIILPKLSDEQTPTTKTYLDLLTAIADKGVKSTPGNTRGYD